MFIIKGTLKNGPNAGKVGYLCPGTKTYSLGPGPARRFKSDNLPRSLARAGRLLNDAKFVPAPVKVDGVSAKISRRSVGKGAAYAEPEKEKSKNAELVEVLKQLPNIKHPLAPYVSADDADLTPVQAVKKVLARVKWNAKEKFSLKHTLPGAISRNEVRERLYKKHPVLGSAVFKNEGGGVIYQLTDVYLKGAGLLKKKTEIDKLFSGVPNISTYITNALHLKVWDGVPRNLGKWTPRK